MWEIDNQLQVIGLLRAAALGGCFCLLYDLLRAVRLSKVCSDLEVFLQDILYFALLAPVTFCFLLVTTNGEIRGYALFGIVVGFTAVRLTVSVILVKALKLVFSGFFSLSNFLRRVNIIFWQRFDAVFFKMRRRLRYFFQKVANSLKKLLKKR